MLEKAAQIMIVTIKSSTNDILGDDAAFIQNPRIAAGLKQARERIQTLMETDPAFAVSMRSVAIQTVLEEYDVLQEAYSRSDSDSVFQETYGKELAGLIGANIVLPSPR